MNKKPKYFGLYHGPSYGGWESEYVMGFFSLEDAKHTFRQFWNGYSTHDEYRENADGFYVPWDMGKYSATPATTREDFMDLYSVGEAQHCGTYFMSDSVDVRLTWGPRNGIVVER